MERLIKRRGLILLIGGILAVISVYSLAIPLLDGWVARVVTGSDASTAAVDRSSLTQDIVSRLSRSLTVLWVFVLGTCVGSFLNVVIYRVPLGISVLVKGSYCPQCREPIRPQDNVPLLGWLRLRGECRNCGLAISSRYPIVELVIGLLFLLLFFTELISGGANLPVRSPNRMTGVQWIVFEMQWDLIALYLYHCFILCALFCWAMIGRDGHRVPHMSVFIILAMTLVAPVALPHLLPWPWRAGSDGLLPHPSLTALATSTLGMIAGAVAAGVLSIDLRKVDAAKVHSAAASWMLIGAGLGWQAVAAVFVLTLAWQSIAIVVGGFVSKRSPADVKSRSESPEEGLPDAAGPVPGQLVLPLVVLIHHLVWRQLAAVFVEF